MNNDLESPLSTINTPSEPAPEDYQQPTAPAEQPPKPLASSKKNKRLLALGLFLLLLFAMGATYWLLKSPSKPASSSQSAKSAGINLSTSQKAASTKNQSSVNFAVGYVNYNAQKLKPIQSAVATQQKLSQISAPETDSKYSSVGFFQVNVDTYTQQLVMYDFAKKTTYLVDQELGKVRNFYNPVILSDHYVAYYLDTQQDPTTLDGSVEVVDLLSGEKTTILTDSADKLPWSACCSVSPDGLHLAMAIPQNKLVIYTAGNPNTQTITTTAQFVPKTTGQDNNSYASAMRAYGYPKITWADNSSLVVATGAPVEYTVDSQGTHIAPAKNGLAILNLTTGKLEPVIGTNDYEIAWYDVSSNNKLVFAAYSVEETLSGGPATGSTNIYIMDYPSGTPVSVSGITHEMLGSIVLDSASNKLYLQDSKTSDIQVVNLADSKIGSPIKSQGTLIEGIYSGSTLITGNRDSTLPSTQLNLLDSSSSTLTTIY